MRWLALAATLLLAACQVTVFRELPAQAGSHCPDWLAGVWSSVDGQDPEFHAELAGDCRATLWMLSDGVWRRAEARIRVADDLLFVAVADILPLFEEGAFDAVPDGHFGWRIRRIKPTLELAYPAQLAISEAIAAGTVRGEVRKLEQVTVLAVEQDPADLVDRLGAAVAFSETDILRLRRSDRLPEGLLP